MALAKVHMIREARTGSFPRTVTTHCGMKGWHESGTEYSTVMGNIFDATNKPKRVTCVRCARAADRNVEPQSGARAAAAAPRGVAYPELDGAD